LIQYLPLVGNTLREYDIKGGDTVGSDHHDTSILEEIYIAYLAMIYMVLSG
jgi:hypothetical protein